MLAGVSVRDPYEITDVHEPRARLHTVDGHPEMWFLSADRDRVLPVLAEGRTVVVPWGGRRGGQLPVALWIRQDTLDAGELAALEPEEAVIRCDRALDNGIWYAVAGGIRAVLLRDSDQGRPVVYPLVEPASSYYAAMTHAEWMPRLVGQQI